MSLAHTSPSLGSRIAAAQSRTTTIHAAISGVRPHDPRSYSERYRGTEFASTIEPERPVPQPLVSTGRTFVIVSGVAVATILSVIAISMPG